MDQENRFEFKGFYIEGYSIINVEDLNSTRMYVITGLR